MNLTVDQTLKSVISYLETQGVIVDYNEIHNHIMSTQQNVAQNVAPEPAKKKKIKLKPKKTNTKQINTDQDITKKEPISTSVQEKPKPKKLKFKPKVKAKTTDFQSFVEICNSNNLYYFQFNDENNWKGPSIKVDQDTFDFDLLKDIELHVLEGYGFAIVRPKKHESDKKIVYNELNYDNCKLMDDDILSLNGSDDESQNDYDVDTDYEEEEIITEDWTYIPKNIIYQLDTKTNNIYCNQTNQYVGKKIDDFTIDYETKEHEFITIEA